MDLFALWKRVLTGKRQPSESRPKRSLQRVRPGLERLEDRTVPTVNFGFAFPLAGNFFSHGQAIATDQSGNLYVTGYFAGPADFDPGLGVTTLNTPQLSQNTFIAKYTSAGALVWAKYFDGGTFNSNQGTGIAVDSTGNVYTTGYFSGTVDFDTGSGTANLTSVFVGDDGYVCKHDSNGNYVWVEQFHGSASFGAHPQAITLDSTDNIYTTGSFNGTVDFNPGSGTTAFTSAALKPDIFVCKLTNSGSSVWADQLGGNNQNNVGSGIAVDGSGNVYSTGFFTGSADFDPGPSSFVLSTPSTSVQNIYVSKLDKNGSFVWAEQMSGTANGAGQGITVDSTGNLYYTGYFQGTTDFDPGTGTHNLSSVSGSKDAFGSKLDTNGNLVWLAPFAGTSTDIGQAITLDSFGEVYTTGQFTGTVDFDPGSGTANVKTTFFPDVFVSELDNSGNYVYAGALGDGNLTNLGTGIAVDHSGNIDTIGYYFGTGDFDPGPNVVPLTSTSDTIFVSQLTQSGGTTGLTLTSSSTNNTSVVGQSVTFTATVQGSGGTPTGTVDIQDTTTGTDLGTASLKLVNGLTQATLTSSFSTAASHTITATYLGTSSFTKSSSSLNQTVNPAKTSVSVSSSVTPSVFGQSVTLKATVAVLTPGAGTPSGFGRFLRYHNQHRSGLETAVGRQCQLVDFHSFRGDACHHRDLQRG